MIYHIGDRLVLRGIECKVAYLNAYGEAYLTPEADVEGEYRLLVGCVFAIIDSRGRDAKGNRAVAISNIECGAV